MLILAPGANNGDISGYSGLSDILLAKISSGGLIEWSRTLGGTSSDTFKSCIINPDSSIIILGYTSSTNGSFSSNHGETDVFLSKFNANGVLLWSKCFGGSLSEYLQSYFQKANGNIIALASSNSSNFNVPQNKGDQDIWIFEVNTSGDIVWSKVYGGSLYEDPKQIIKTGENQYSISAETSSKDKDVSNFHLGTGYDIWVLTIDNTGNIIWKKTFGGSASEYSPVLRLNESDSTILLTCSTNSSDGDIVGYHGNSDLFISKLTNSGSILWSKTIGGSGTENQLTSRINPNGNSIYLCSTNSNDGDVITANWRTAYYDQWIFELSQTGIILWQKRFGGSLVDNPLGIRYLSDGYIVLGNTSSYDGNIKGNHCIIDSSKIDTGGYYYNIPQDIWLAKISLDGIPLWQRSVGGYSNESLSSVIVDNDEIFIFGKTNSNDGDVSNNHGSNDSWLLQLGAVNNIKGKVFFDKNLNGSYDSSEAFINTAIVESSKSDYSKLSILTKGGFLNEVDTGNFVTAVQLQDSYFTIIPTSHTSIFSSYFEVDSVIFAVQPIPNKEDLTISIMPLTQLRAGGIVSYKLNYKNNGTTTITNGYIKLVKDSRTTFQSATPSPATINSDTLVWNFMNFKPFDTSSIILNLKVPAAPTVNINDTLKFTSVILPVVNDLTPSNDTANLKQIVTGSYDPNDKQENYAGAMPVRDVNNGSYINYFIRFQNTGNDTAFVVRVNDTLDANLDWNSFQMIGSSHAYNLSIKDGNKLMCKTR